MTIRKWSTQFIAGLLAAALFYTGTVLAVGFGDISLKSVLNEPLHAEIGLNNLGGLKNSEMRAQLGSAEAFSRSGISRDSHLTELDFAIIDNIWGERVISITSDKPVVEPFLDFLVQLEWPGGRIMREYTVLLDLPIYKTNQVITPIINQVAPSGVPQTGLNLQNIAGTQHRVVEGDTLWNVAKRLKPSGLTILQTMDALFSQNPEAFVEGDANRLIKGMTIRLPSKTEISREAGDLVAEQIGLRPTEQEALSQQIAESQLTGQVNDELFLDTVYDEGQESAGGLAHGARGLTDSARDFQENPDGRLELASAYDINQPDDLLAEAQQTENIAQATAAGLDGIAASEIQQLTSKLTLAQDEINKTQLENIELRERIALLQAQVDTLATLVEVAERTQANAAEQSAEPAAGKPAASQAIISQLEQQSWTIWGGLGALILLLLFMLRRTSAPVSEEATFPDTADSLNMAEADIDQQPEPKEEPEPNEEPEPQEQPESKEEPQPEPEPQPNQEPAAGTEPEPKPETKAQSDSEGLDDLELVGDEDIDELTASVLDEDFLDDSFMDGGIFADIAADTTPASTDQQTDVGDISEFATSFDDFEDLDDVAEINPVDVKLDLANTYIEMGDSEGAREILEEIIGEADDLGQARAQAVLNTLDNN